MLPILVYKPCLDLKTASNAANAAWTSFWETRRTREVLAMVGIVPSSQMMLAAWSLARRSLS